ncbi:hypothetical protein Peur_073024 [Populus x canadensis]
MSTPAHPQDLLMTYKTIKLLPTVGCEAEAATRYSMDERVVGGVDNNVSVFAYQSGGSCAAVWPIVDNGSSAVSTFDSSQNVLIQELIDDKVWKDSIWLFDHGYAVTSRCIFSSDVKLKEILIAHETAMSEGV